MNVGGHDKRCDIIVCKNSRWADSDDATVARFFANLKIKWDAGNSPHYYTF